MKIQKRTGQLLSTAALASLIVMTPYVPTFDAEGHLRLEPAYAFAKSGKGSDGDGGDDDRDGNSGSGSGGDRDDDRDDSSGSGKGGRDSDDDDDDDDDDDGSSRSGRGSGSGKTDRSQSGGRPSGSAGITKVETSASGIEVRYADGTKEEIENGRYERKNAQNRTVEERPATGADVSRLRSMANGISIDSVRSQGQSGGAGSRPAKIEIQGNNIEVSYTNGWKEEIEGGRYELKDPFNRTVVERNATAADRQRLQSVAN
ncbi:hypothetical protein [Ruegeria sp. HKCCSP351]|uniref:hypothetical protein n=1 Tax=Ruegeria sp. HKCCSP351 TaxID=2794832 RepID=UPI001FD7E2DF|nr:hypothetical protein [Ruegeria sp. HKCCSP351]